MFSSLFRGRIGNRFGGKSQSQATPSPGRSHGNGNANSNGRNRATADFTEADDDEEDSNEEDLVAPDEDGFRRGSIPMLPLFSTSYLDSIPVYSLTHSIRVIISTRTETTLSWDQLRSPQVSQFLVKPMQQQIMTQHFSRATLYTLMANCLQFAKEGQLYPGNAGTSSTRAKVCELLAIKLLKEYTTRELIDALSYDFYPLQGSPSSQVAASAAGRSDASSKATVIASRTSTLEVAIRAAAKHFLAHPLVVQQLEGIWNGAISFYSSADSLHRDQPPSPVVSGIGRHRGHGKGKADARTPLLSAMSPGDAVPRFTPGRRTVALYDPRQASLFKLSRLRVPRYRFFLGTLSLAILILLFLTVLMRRSPKITSLELVFWFWSAGFMLDEVVGFNEQGFALYLMNFWNIFDLGILLLLIVYYLMRVYGVFLVDAHHWNAMAYDVLAANAILLLPRIFSVLDHHPYFSQLLIAFRLMAVDLAAVLVLVLISCSGFFVFFTMSKTDNNGADVAYRIFQILMGFTPGAWEVWPEFSWLEKMIMILFLIICHFVVVTILITVLTNSFMTIASNATEEHQFLFALNTISMVKNDALFSYVAPSNIFAWILMPLRYCMPLKQFVWLNRIVIKLTHVPILLCIFLYEKFWLATTMYEPTDLVDHPGRGRHMTISFADGTGRGGGLFSPNTRVREESEAGFYKDRALDEVFRRMPDVPTLKTQRRHERMRTQTAIRDWMDQHEEDRGVSAKWPTIDSRNGSRVPIEWNMNRRLSMSREPSQLRRLRRASDARSVASDPADTMSNSGMLRPSRLGQAHAEAAYRYMTDADGDDELITNDEEDEEEERATNAPEGGEAKTAQDLDGYFAAAATTTATTPASTRLSRAATMSPRSPASQQLAGQDIASIAGPSRDMLHNRTMSSSTILFNPLRESLADMTDASPSPPQPRSRPIAIRNQGPATSGAGAGAGTAGAANVAATAAAAAAAERRRSPRRPVHTSSGVRARPIQPPRTKTDILTPRHLASLDTRTRNLRNRRLSSIDLSVQSDNSGVVAGADDSNLVVPSSFQTQMMAMMEKGRMAAQGQNQADNDRMSRLVLARMNKLEESFAEVIKEMREMRGSSTTSPTRLPSSAEEEGVTAIEASERNAKPSKSHTVGPSRKAGSKRPASQRSSKEGKSPTLARGKGKELVASSDSDDEAPQTK